MRSRTMWRWHAAAVAAIALALLPLGAAVAAPSGSWSYVYPMKLSRMQQTATLLFTGKVLIAGGETCNTSPCSALASAELYNPNTASFTSTSPMPVARFGQTATLLFNGLVLVAGGCSTGTAASCTTSLASAELYSSKTGKWSPTGSMTTSRVGHTATLLASGQVLVTGGESCATATCSVLASAEVYTPSTGKWAATTTPMTTARVFHTATLIASGPAMTGTVLIAGGYGCTGICGSAELYNPTTNSFTATGSMSTERASQTSIQLSNGTGDVLIAGGINRCNYGCFPTNVAELYNPATQTFTDTATTMVTARYLHAAARLKNGEVLVLGGGGCYGGCPLTNAELYNPTTNSWTATGSLNAARVTQTATLLSTGKVLTTGGYNFANTSNTLKSAEVYQP